jgi:tetratricopeptide (TPR) repeat protein
LALLLALWLANLVAADEHLRVGSVSLVNSGRPEAQEDFAEGLAALHSFWYEVARDAFRSAQEKDPGFALAYWGEAMTHYRALWNGVASVSGRRPLELLDERAGERLASEGTEEERALIESARRLFGEGSASGEDAFSESLRHAHERLPESVEIAAFYALSLQGRVSSYVRRDEDDWALVAQSADILERLFERAPEHPGVLHYLIHAYDDPEHAELGLPAARRYARVAPDASHAQHMPSHIFIQLGDWRSSVASNRKAWEVSERWVEQEDLPNADKDFHALGWLHYSLLQLGDFEGADGVLQILRDNNGRSSSEARYMARRLIESEDWALEGGDGGDESRFAHGLAAAWRGDLDAAREEAEALESAGGSDAEILHLSLEGLLAHLEGDSSQALELLADAARREDATRIPSGPPDLVKPALELYGEVLLLLDRCEEAREAFDRSLARMPGRRLSARGASQAAACAP